MEEKLSFLLLGNSNSAEQFADGLIRAGCSCVAAVSLAKDLLPDNSDGLKSWSEKLLINQFLIYLNLERLELTPVNYPGEKEGIRCIGK